MSGVIVEVSARKFTVPFECPCCGAAPDAEIAIPLTRTSGKRVLRDAMRGFDFPYCQKCMSHVTTWESARTLSSGVGFLGISVGVIVGMVTSWLFGLLVFVAAIPLAMLVASSRHKTAKAGCGPSCAAPGKAVAYLGWSGSVSSFSFESPTYTARFAEQNERKLVNLSTQLRKLIEGHRVARLLVPTPAAPVTIASQPPTVTEWIAKIGSFPGSVARRMTVQRALEVVLEPRERRELLAGAMRIELAATFNRVDELSSPMAKKRQLQKVIDQVRADNIPDELQATELGELESRLKALGQ